MWTFLGIFLAVFLQRFLVNGFIDPSIFDSNPYERTVPLCSFIKFPTNEQNINWEEVKSKLETSIKSIKKTHAYHTSEKEGYFYESSIDPIFNEFYSYEELLNRSERQMKMVPALETLKAFIPYLPTDSNDKKLAYSFFRSVLIFGYPYPYPKENCASFLGTEYSVPFPQYQYVSRLFSLLNSASNNQKETCELTQSLGRTATKPIRDYVSTVCGEKENGDLCHLNQFFKLTNIFEDIICNMKYINQTSWNTDSKDFNLYRYSINLLLYTFKRQMPPKYNSLIDLSVLSDQNVKDTIHNLITELYKKVENSEVIIHSVLDAISTIVPSKSRLIGDGIVKYPSYNWMLSTGVNALKQVRSLVARFGVGKARKQKSLDTQIDYRQYIQNLKTTQIKEMTDSIPSNIQALGNSIGTYYDQVASYEKRKKSADISFLQSTVSQYDQAFREATSKLTRTMVPLLSIYLTGATTEFAEDTAKLALQIAAAGNPLKWVLGGDPGDLLDTAGDVAESSRKFTDALRNIEAYGPLVKFNGEISRKLAKNEGPLKAVSLLLNEIEKSSTSKGFSKLQDDFISQYTAYTPAIRKDELKELTVHWENFVDAICTGIENTGGVAANAARGIGDTRGKCSDAKLSAAKLTVCLEEIYDFQFELMETMASLMHSFVQIESAKALGTYSQDTLTTKDFEIIASIIGISYKITQSNNIEMLCNIMEYQNGGKRPSICEDGLLTDIDILTAIERPNYNKQKQYVKVPTQRSIPVNDALAWFDLRKLYAGETIVFRVPNSTWLINQGWISPHLIDKALYIKHFSITLPVVSQSGRKISVIVIPTYVGNRLFDTSDTYYSISNSHQMVYSYMEGHGQHHCLIQPTIDNPYSQACNQGSDYPSLCLLSEGTTTQIKEQFFPSIYSEFLIKVHGYKDANLSVPATKLNVQVGLTYYFLSEKHHNKRTAKKQQNFIIKREVASCCPQNNYLNSDINQCQACPKGTTGFYGGLFCGDLIQIVEANATQTPKTATFTYEMAVARCNEAGFINIANLTRIHEAEKLGAKSCTCGWISGKKVVSVGDRSDCPFVGTRLDCQDTGSCSRESNIRHVYCTTTYKP